MTRINLVNPATLHDKHLLAEYRELPRVYALAFAAQQRGWRPTDPRIPATFCLGRGHVTFFYNKLGWLDDRFQQLVDVMWLRGWNPNFITPPRPGLSAAWYGMWEPTPEDILLSSARIQERMPK